MACLALSTCPLRHAVYQQPAMRNCSDDRHTLTADKILLDRLDDDSSDGLKITHQDVTGMVMDVWIE